MPDSFCHWWNSYLELEMLNFSKIACYQWLILCRGYYKILFLVFFSSLTQFSLFCMLIYVIVIVGFFFGINLKMFCKFIHEPRSVRYSFKLIWIDIDSFLKISEMTKLKPNKLISEALSVFGNCRFLLHKNMLLK